MQTFDEAAFKAKFRAAAARRGIDPVAGATGYQAALVQAELRVLELTARGVYGWSRGRDLFSEPDARRCGDAQIILVDPERIVEAGPLADLVPIDGVLIAELWRELRQALRSELRSQTPLKTIHTRQLDHAGAPDGRRLLDRQALSAAPV